MRHHAGKIRPQIDAIDRRLSSFTDSKRQRIDAMCRASRGNLSSRNIYRAMEWIERNRQHFRGRIYGPVVAEIQSRNDQHAVYLENQVPAYVWESFLTTYSEDRALLERELVGNQDVNINILSAPWRVSERSAPSRRWPKVVRTVSWLIPADPILLQIRLLQLPLEVVQALSRRW